MHKILKLKKKKKKGYFKSTCKYRQKRSKQSSKDKKKKITQCKSVGLKKYKEITLFYINNVGLYFMRAVFGK